MQSLYNVNNMNQNLDINSPSHAATLQSFIQKLEEIANNSPDVRYALHALLLDLAGSDLDPVKLACETYQNAWKR
jgi:hypothetical protein